MVLEDVEKDGGDEYDYVLLHKKNLDAKAVTRA